MLALLPYINVLAQTQPDYQVVIGALILKATIALALSRPVLDLFGLDEDTDGWKPAVYACGLVFGVLLLVDYSVSILTLQKIAENIVVALLSAATIRKAEQARAKHARAAVREVVEETKS